MFLDKPKILNIFDVVLSLTSCRTPSVDKIYFLNALFYN